MSFFWALQLFVVEIFTVVWFPLADLREVWLTSHGAVPSYFVANASIGVCLAYLAANDLAADLALPRDKGRVVTGVALLVFISGFGIRLAFLGTHHLGTEWYARAILDEPVDSGREYLAIVVDSADHSVARVLLETCEQVTVEIPENRAAGDFVAVREWHSRFTAIERYEFITTVDFDDPCLLVQRFVRGCRFERRVKHRCG